MKEIIHNEDNLRLEDINNVVKRAKVLIINSSDEFLLARVNNDIHIVGGHVDGNETDEEAIVREVKEELGITLPYTKRDPIVCIKYMCKNFPKENQNTLFIANYYVIESDLKPDLNNTNLEVGEIEGNFESFYVKKDEVLDVLNESLKTATNKNVVYDTIDVLKEYLS